MLQNLARIAGDRQAKGCGHNGPYNRVHQDLLSSQAPHRPAWTGGIWVWSRKNCRGLPPWLWAGIPHLLIHVYWALSLYTKGPRFRAVAPWVQLLSITDTAGLIICWPASFAEIASTIPYADLYSHGHELFVNALYVANLVRSATLRASQHASEGRQSQSHTMEFVSASPKNRRPMYDESRMSTTAMCSNFQSFLLIFWPRMSICKFSLS